MLPLPPLTGADCQIPMTRAYKGMAVQKVKQMERWRQARAYIQVHPAKSVPVVAAVAVAVAVGVAVVVVAVVVARVIWKQG